MIVELPGTASDYRIGKVKYYKMGFFHFSNNNLSIRKACAKSVGMYDPKTHKSEDVDICFRVARNAQWVALREKGNRLRHKARKTFSGFVKQMWGWGYHVGYPYAKTGMKGIYLYWIDAKSHRISYAIEIDKFPLLVCMFLTDFHVAHLLLSATAFLVFMGQGVAATIFACPTVYFLWRYLYDDLGAGLSLWQTCRLAAVHYVANLVFNLATICGAIKYRLILIPSAIFRPNPYPEH